MIEPHPDMRSTVRALLDELNMDATTASLAIGRGKDYLRDFLSGRKATIGAREIEALSALRGNARSQISVIERLPRPHLPACSKARANFRTVKRKHFADFPALPVDVRNFPH